MTDRDALAARLRDAVGRLSMLELPTGSYVDVDDVMATIDEETALLSPAQAAEQDRLAAQRERERLRAKWNELTQDLAARPDRAEWLRLTVIVMALLAERAALDEPVTGEPER